MAEAAGLHGQGGTTFTPHGVRQEGFLAAPCRRDTAGGGQAPPAPRPPGRAPGAPLAHQDLVPLEDQHSDPHKRPLRRLHSF